MGPVQNDGCLPEIHVAYVQSSEGPRREEKFDKLDEGDINRWILNQAMATNPFVRYLTSMMYLSNVNGLSKDQLSE